MPSLALHVNGEPRLIDRESDVPAILIDLVSRPKEPPPGVGEAAAAPVPAAVASPVFDAVGARLTTALLTRERVRASLT